MTAAFFLLITCCALLLFYLGTGRDKKLILVSCAWTIFIGALAWSGFFRLTPAQPWRFLIIPVSAIAFCIYSYRKLQTTWSGLTCLLALHALRLPVELVLYRLFQEKKIPELMTFNGWNFDIVTGITAVLLLAYVLLSGRNLNRKLLWTWNIMGLVLLGIIVVLAILSAPLPFQQFGRTQPNIAILDFPYTLLPACVVPLVLASHLLSFKLIRRAK